MRIVECEQGSSEWLAARCGRITASHISDVLGTLKKGGETAKRAHYRAEIVGERMTGDTEDHYMAWYMRQGKEREPDARLAYGMEHGVFVEEQGFALHPAMDFSGSSPDGLIGRDGGLEIKCPKTTTHVEYLVGGTIPEEYEPQMVWNMVCWEREWWDFWSWHPKLPPLKVRLHRDEKRISEIDAAVRKFNDEVEEVICRLRGGSPTLDALRASLEEA